MVFGLVADADGKESIHGSLRTVRATLSPDQFLKETLGCDEDGHYYGGGRAMAGGFEIPMGFLSGCDDRNLMKMKWTAYDARIRKRLFDRLGVGDSPA